MEEIQISHKSIDDIRKSITRMHDELKRSIIELMDTRTIKALIDLVNIVPELLCVVDPETGKFLLVNDSWIEALEYSFVELTSTPFINFVHPKDKERTINAWTSVSQNDDEEAGADFINTYISKTGKEVKILWLPGYSSRTGLVICRAKLV